MGGRRVGWGREGDAFSLNGRVGLGGREGHGGRMWVGGKELGGLGVVMYYRIPLTAGTS